MRERRGRPGRGCGDKMIRSEFWGYPKLPGILLKTREEILGSGICNKVFFLQSSIINIDFVYHHHLRI